MPYTGANDEKLPENVKKLDEKQREKWVSAFNSALDACEEKAGKDCEASAFAIANAAATKEDEAVAEEASEETAQPETDKEPDTEGKLSKIVGGFVDAIRKLFNPSPDEPASEEEPTVKNKEFIGSFKLFKQANGGYRWLGIPTNKWRDRDMPAQIIEEAAHKDFVDYLDKTKDYPVLMSWHTPGTEIGVADFADYTKGFLIMGGSIYKDKQVEADILALKCQTEQIGMSHGFVYTYSDKKKEIIGSYRTWEVSHLPIDKAANVWTSFDILKELQKKEVKLDPQKRKYLVEIHSEEFVNGLETKLASLEKDLQTAGIEFKEIVPPQPVDTAQLVKAVSEDASFKELFSGIKLLTDALKQVNEVTLPALTKRIEEAEKLAKGAETKAQKSIDDILAGAYTAKGGYRASTATDNKLSEEDKAKEKTYEIKTPIDKSMFDNFRGMLGSAPVDPK